MDVTDGEDEASVSSPILNSVDSQQKEDLAWADSCLIEDSDILESTWDPLKNALLEIISSTPESFNTDGGTDIEILPSNEDNNNAGFQGTRDDWSSVSNAFERIADNIQDDNMAYTQPSCSFEENIGPVSEGNMQASNHTNAERSSGSSSTYNATPVGLATANSDDIPENEKTENLPPPVFQGNPFLPTYSEDREDNETMDSGLNLDSLAHDTEQSSDDIFKIWDLNIPTEDEFVKQLNKALATNPLQMKPSPFDHLGQWKVMERGSPDNLVSSKNSEQLNVLEEGPLDDLIEGFANLSLNS
ncbi:uncharacterized protein LOC114762208 [Neltuma alba]|uniref:uncharacterized protein LOC114762208 n=1 Tax=Neltuma alba TaxID=207710 RepID=UPI0010A48606|nr:uncharacterized protein LOC114762208 [Prosopis alba]XP_028807500.1 uncharacterized protein LOC114762208 [Prosopis alba]XP_028807501.1 uncharacterized protein LOC114762208 [Prosopis alba]XP_028807502.1 uncharacterized protein LOC114762208 [Prosopis alba]